MVVSVDYQSPSECPDEGTFGSELRGRNANVSVSPAATPTESVPRLVVRVVRRGGASGQVTFRGELVVRYPDGTLAKRSVDGDACPSVVDALALMSAMTLDPAGTLAGKSGTPAPPEPTPLPLTPPPPDATPPATAKDVERGAHLSTGLGANTVLGIGPGALPEGLGFLELSWKNESLWSPAVRVAVSYAGGPAESVTGGGVTTSRTEARVDACPLRWGSGPWRVLPCAGIEGGVLAAAGDGVTPSLHALRPWFAAGLVGKVQWRVGRSFFLEVVGGATVPFVRDHFFFQPNAATTVYQAPVVTGFFGIGGGFTIL
jgi:hypothetical protein